MNPRPVPDSKFYPRSGDEAEAEAEAEAAPMQRSGGVARLQLFGP